MVMTIVIELCATETIWGGETLDMDLSSKLSFITLSRGVPNMIINKMLILQTGGDLEEEPAS